MSEGTLSVIDRCINGTRYHVYKTVKHVKLHQTPERKRPLSTSKVDHKLFLHVEILMYVSSRLYSKVWPMLSIFDSDKQKIAVGN
jgi:hypothetical protein